MRAFKALLLLLPLSSVFFIVPPTGATVVSLSWSPDSLQTAITDYMPHHGAYLVIVDTTEILDVSFNLAWCTIPEAQGIVTVADSLHLGLPTPPGNWIRAEPAGTRDSLNNNRCFCKFLSWDGEKGFSNDTLRIYLPLRYRFSTANAPVWFRIGHIKLKTKRGFVNVAGPDCYLSLNATGHEPPPLIEAIDPPSIVSDYTATPRVFMIGRELSKGDRMIIVGPEGDSLALGPISVDSDSLIWATNILNNNVLGSWRVVLVDSSGRYIEGPSELAIWDGAIPFYGESGDSIDNPYTADSAEAAPGVIVIWARNGAIIFPEEHMEDSLSPQQVVTAPSLLYDLEEVGITSIEKMYQRLDESETWTEPDEENIQHPNLDLGDIYRLRYPPEEGLTEKLKVLARNGNIVWVEPEYYDVPDAIPNDQVYGSQWNLRHPFMANINIEPAWDYETGDQSVILGVLDSGVDYTHPDFGSGLGSGYTVTGGWNWYNNNSDIMDIAAHGTRCTGVIGSRTNNSLYTAGIVGGWWGASGEPGIAIQGHRVGYIDGNGDLWMPEWPQALVESSIPISLGGLYGCDVFNLSLGSYNSTLTKASAVAFAYLFNTTIVASKGNDGTNDFHVPSDYPWAIGVGASDQDGERVVEGGLFDWSSNYGNDMDVLAPGVVIVGPKPVASDPNNPIDSDFGGTSAAAPHVAALSALIKCRWPHRIGFQITNDDIVELIRISAMDVGAPGYDEFTGFGVIDAGKALSYLEVPYEIRYVVNRDPQWTFDGSYTYYFTPLAGGELEGSHDVDRYRVEYTVEVTESEYAEPPHIWAVKVWQHSGWSMSSPNLQMPWVEVEQGPGDWTWHFTTYVYKVYEQGGGWQWYPKAPEDVEFRWRQLGISSEYVGVAESGDDGSLSRAPSLRIEPNPFNANTTIKYVANAGQKITISIYDINGRHINTIVKGQSNAVENSAHWDGLNSAGNPVSSGVYFFKLSVGDTNLIRKGVLLR